MEAEQITAIPKEEVPIKVMDPKKVAAGKALAERNRKAREAQKKLESMDTSNLTLHSVMQIAAVVGAGFTLYHGYQAVKPYLSGSKKEAYETPVEVTYVPKKEKEEKNVASKGIDME